MPRPQNNMWICGMPFYRINGPGACRRLICVLLYFAVLAGYVAIIKRICIRTTEIGKERCIMAKEKMKHLSVLCKYYVILTFFNFRSLIFTVSFFSDWYTIFYDCCSPNIRVYGLTFSFPSFKRSLFLF